MSSLLALEMAPKAAPGFILFSSSPRSLMTLFMIVFPSESSKMLKSGPTPISFPSLRRIRLQMEWKVPLQGRLWVVICGLEVSSFATRCFISSAALLVKVTSNIFSGFIPWEIRWAAWWVSTRVFPEPGPAITKAGPSQCSTASICSGFKPANKSSTSTMIAEVKFIF